MKLKGEYDVIVVGAGPAGSMAALTAARSGLDTLLIEKRQEIGAPLRCAEAVGMDTLRRLVEPNPRWICTEISAFRIVAPNGKSVKVPPTEPTVILERKVFDRDLAHLAAMAGCAVRVKTQATGLLSENGKVVGVRLSGMDGEAEVRAKVVIAADGPESQLAQWAGLARPARLHDMGVAVQYVLSGLELDPTVCEYHLGSEIAPGGYGWVFPKGEHMANVGVGVPADVLDDGTSALDYLERMVERLFPDASPVGLVVGGVPVGGPLKKLATDGLMVIGDAAHQADPMTGGGIGYGMEAGKLAAECAVEAIRRGDTSRRSLKAYERQWLKANAGFHKRSYRARELFRALSDDTLNSLMEIAVENPVEKVGLRGMVMAVFKNHPRLLLEASAALFGEGITLT